MPNYSQMLMGRYSPGQTPAHRLDTRIKVAMIGLYSVAIWSVHTWTGMGLMFLVCAGWAFLARDFALRMLAPVRGMTVVSLFVLAYYLWSGVTLGEPGWLNEIWNAATRTLFLIGKIALILVSATWLYMFTPPLKVVDALGSLLGPLARFKIPVREFSFVVGLILRFFPDAIVRIGEYYRLLQLRGKSTGGASAGRLARIGDVLKRVIDTMVLYMHYSLHGAQMVALSLLARGYNPFRPVQATRFLNPGIWEFCVLVLSCGVILVAAIYF